MNWTENRMAVSAADLNVLLNAEGNLDFNLVIPKPRGARHHRGRLAKASGHNSRGEAPRRGKVRDSRRFGRPRRREPAERREIRLAVVVLLGERKLGHHIERLRHVRGALRQIRRRKLQDGVVRARSPDALGPRVYVLDAEALDDEHPERLRAAGGLYDEQTIARHLQ